MMRNSSSALVGWIAVLVIASGAGGVVVVGTSAQQAVGAPVGPVVNVRWVPTLDAEQLVLLERSLGLALGRHREGTTWRYQLEDSSPDRVSAIVRHESVEDTHGFDRGNIEAGIFDERPEVSTPFRNGMIAFVLVAISGATALILLRGSSTEPTIVRNGAEQCPRSRSSADSTV